MTSAKPFSPKPFSPLNEMRRDSRITVHPSEVVYLPDPSSCLLVLLLTQKARGGLGAPFKRAQYIKITMYRNYRYIVPMSRIIASLPSPPPSPPLTKFLEKFHVDDIFHFQPRPQATPSFSTFHKKVSFRSAEGGGIQCFPPI